MGEVLYPKSVSFCSVVLVTWGQALSWSKIMTKLEFMQKKKKKKKEIQY